MEEITAKQRQSLDFMYRWRRFLLPLFVFDVGCSVFAVWDKRAQLAGLPTLESAANLSILASVWMNVTSIIIFSYILVHWWSQVNRYQEILAREERERTSAASPKQSWPPAPRTPRSL